MSDLHWLTAEAAAQAIAARQLSPVELMTALLERIARSRFPVWLSRITMI